MLDLSQTFPPADVVISEALFIQVQITPSLPGLSCVEVRSIMQSKTVLIGLIGEGRKKTKL